MNIQEIATKSDLEKISKEVREIRDMLNSSQVPQEILRSAQVREMLNISDGTLQRLRISGRLHGSKVNGTWFYKIADVFDMLNDEL
jgi:hypothetical protein